MGNQGLENAALKLLGFKAQRNNQVEMHKLAWDTKLSQKDQELPQWTQQKIQMTPQKVGSQMKRSSKIHCSRRLGSEVERNRLRNRVSRFRSLSINQQGIRVVKPRCRLLFWGFQRWWSFGLFHWGLVTGMNNLFLVRSPRFTRNRSWPVNNSITKTRNGEIDTQTRMKLGKIETRTLRTKKKGGNRRADGSIGSLTNKHADNLTVT